MIEQFIGLIHEYQSKIKEALSLLQKQFGVEQSKDWRFYELPQVGYLDADKTITYFFHGIGCEVKLPSGEVDWDFGYEGRIDGFGPWFLWRFANEGTANFAELRDKKKFEEVLQEAVEWGLIRRSFLHFGDSHFYLQDENYH